MFFKKFIALILMAISISISGCGILKQNIQHGNITGEVKDNKWDYYDGRPTHYTSYLLDVHKNTIMIKQEKTDSFSAIINIDKKRNFAIITYNNKTLTLKKFNDEVKVDYWIEKTYGVSANKTKYKGWDAWFESDDEKLKIAVSYSKQILLTSFEDGENMQHIGYYPSRYLACKKIANVKIEKDKRVVFDLLRTALVAGVQSYTSYSTTRYTTSYGDFGYAVSRDYSWAGDRAADALGALFSGEYSDGKIQQAWNGLNCW